MTYKAVFTDEFLSYFRLDDNGKTLVLTDGHGLTRAVTLEAERHGEWKADRKETVVRYGDEYEVHIPYCSECGWKRSNVYEYLGPGKVKWNFCPECGADMRTKNVNKK